jgi:hypothetical protein
MNGPGSRLGRVRYGTVNRPLHVELLQQVRAAPSPNCGQNKKRTFLQSALRWINFRKDDRFFVETDGPDGALATFEVKYTFGIDPLQQYLIEFPDGRLQALTIAWDSRPKEQGGQRWFHLYPGEHKYGYVYAIALHSLGQTSDAMRVLADGLARHPDNQDMLLALVTFHRDAGDIPSALKYAERLVKIAPNNQALNALIQQLRLQSKE